MLAPQLATHTLSCCPATRLLDPPAQHNRQTLLFSATMPRRVERLAGDALTSPVRITVGEVGAANEDIRQVRRRRWGGLWGCVGAGCVRAGEASSCGANEDALQVRLRHQGGSQQHARSQPRPTPQGAHPPVLHSGAHTRPPLASLLSPSPPTGGRGAA